MEYKKISVLIVTYRQADVIGRNIESIIKQREYGLHEIIICDDCSPDNNWDVIQSYVKKYPDLIRAYRNNPNLGIYGNSDKCASLHGDADLYCWLEGDDALCEGFFKSIQQAILDQNIDTNQAVAIQANYKTIYPNGNETIFVNDYLSKHACDPISAKLRGLITWRASVFSSKVIQNFKPTILNRGLALAEELFDIQWFVYSKYFYYVNVPGSIYYAQIGVSVSLAGEEKDKWNQETNYKWDYIANHLLSNQKDIYYSKSQMYLAELHLNKSFFTFLKYLFYFMLGNIGYPIQIKPVLANIKLIRKI